MSRQQFEEWAASQHFAVDAFAGGAYCGALTRGAWCAWEHCQAKIDALKAENFMLTNERDNSRNSAQYLINEKNKRHDSPQQDSFLTNNLLIARDGDGPLFGEDNDGKLFFRLDRYAIMPIEKYEAMKAEVEALRKDAERLNLLEKSGIELTCQVDEDEPFFVSRVTGGRNDQEWKILGTGATVREAIDAAMKEE